MKKKALLFSGIILTAALTSEVILRTYWGFCDTVLMQANPSYEYIALPSQERFRFRKHIRYNLHSMRSEEVDTTKTIILGLGDSVLNGGVLTDQDSLATTQLSNELSVVYGSHVQFLNISAGSWGPDNAHAYIKEKGDFGAKKIYLVISSHDAYDTMNFMPVVGNDPSFPDKQYALAVVELIDRYLLPRLISPENVPENLGINKRDVKTPFNPGFEGLVQYANCKQIPLVVYLHAEQSEMEAGRYNEQGQEIMRYLQRQQVPVIKDLDNGLRPGHFRDNIHYNEAGQRLMAQLIYKYEKAESSRFIVSDTP